MAMTTPAASSVDTRRALAGAVTGAVIGGLGRAAIVLAHLHVSGKSAVLAAGLAALIGAIIGAVAGLTGRPLIGMVLGAGLTFLLYASTLPVAAMFQLLGAATTPSVLEVLAVGVVSGGVGGFVGGRERGRTPRR